MTPTAAMFRLAERSTLLFFAYSLSAERFVYLNPLLRSFFGVSRHVNHADLLALVHPEDRKHLLTRLQECLRGRTVEQVECRIVRDTHQRWLTINPYLFFEGEKKWLMGHAEDITGQKATSDTINKHNSEKNSVLNIIAHDLAGPLGTISNLSTLLRLETATIENQQVKEYLDMISKITTSSIGLIRQYVNHEFLESQGVKLMKRRVELIGKISAVTQEYMDQQKDLKIHFHCHANRDVIYIEIDEDKLMQVINNLISNALKFTPEGGTITIYMEESDRNVLISVTDTGVGIPVRYHATLFDKFSDAGRTGLKGELSTGLGMSIIKTIVEWHKGRVWFRSKEQEGTTFYVDLPK